MAVICWIVCISALVLGCLTTSDTQHCDGDSCDAFVQGFVDRDLKYLEPDSAQDVSIHLLQKKATLTKHATNDKCRRRCRFHPKHDCRLICRISCVQGKPVENQKCKDGDDTTTTTTSTTSNKESTEEKQCDELSTLTTHFNNLVENTLGEDVANPRMVYKDVVVLSKMLENQPDWVNRKLDLTIVDASQFPRYKNNPEKNYVANPFGSTQTPTVKKYLRDSRNYTGTYLETIRINFDEPGSYVFRMTLTDSETGELAPVPLFPLVFYDIDGVGEAVATSDALRVIQADSKLTDVKDKSGCFVHKSRAHGNRAREVNLPTNFERLTPTQRAHAITYVYANKAEWDVQIHLDSGTPQRYFVMKSSNVIACSDEVVNPGQWKGRGKGERKGDE